MTTAETAYTKTIESSGSYDDNSLVCFQCHRENTTVPAFGYCIDCHEHLCQTCYNHHRRPRPCRHHKLLDKDAMPATQQLSDSSEDVGTIDKLTISCIRHKTEMIKLYCHNHGLLLCTICVALEHTKPCHVDYIPEVSHQIINSEEYKCTMYRIDKLLRKCLTVKTETSRRINESNDSLENALLEIRAYKQEINKRIDEIETELKVKIHELQHQNDEISNSVDAVCGEIIDAMKTAYDNMKHLHTSKKANKLFMDVKQAAIQLQECEKRLGSIPSVNTIAEYKFTPSKTIKDELNKEDVIGGIGTKQRSCDRTLLQHKPLASSSNDNINPTHSGEVCVSASEDSYDCFISAMTVLQEDLLVLADMGNNAIKLVYVNSKFVKSQLSLGGEFKQSDLGPFDITVISSTQVAVTMPGRRQILFISVSYDHKLRICHTIQTFGNCYGICCYDDKLIVTYQNAGELQILDLKGKLIKKVKRDATGINIFTQPGYVKANSNSIYVIDCGSCEVIMLNWHGEVTGRFGGFAIPTGLALLIDGSLLATYNAQKSVYTVSGDGTKSNIILTNVERPHAVCVDHSGHKLFISRYTSSQNLPLFVNRNDIVNNILRYNV